MLCALYSYFALNKNPTEKTGYVYVKSGIVIICLHIIAPCWPTQIASLPHNCTNNCFNYIIQYIYSIFFSFIVLSFLMDITSLKETQQPVFNRTQSKRSLLFCFFVFVFKFYAANTTQSSRRAFTSRFLITWQFISSSFYLGSLFLFIYLVVVFFIVY